MKCDCYHSCISAYQRRVSPYSNNYFDYVNQIKFYANCIGRLADEACETTQCVSHRYPWVTECHPWPRWKDTLYQSQGLPWVKNFQCESTHMQISKESIWWELDEFTLLFQQALHLHVLVIEWDVKAIYIWIKTQALKGGSLHWNLLLPSSRIIICRSKRRQLLTKRDYEIVQPSSVLLESIMQYLV